jgi:Tol biopolymer transport system component
MRSYWLGALWLGSLAADPIFAQQQSNSAAAALRINGRAGDGYGGISAQDLVPGSAATIAVSGAPWQPVMLLAGPALDPGTSLAPFGILNLTPSLILMNGFDPSGFGYFATTGSTGTLTVVGHLSLATPIGYEIAFQAAVGTTLAPGIALSAAEVIRADRCKIAFLARGASGRMQVFGSNRYGTATIPFHRTYVQFGDARQPVWSPDGTRIAYLADQNYGTLGELFVTDGDGTDNRRVNGDLIPVGDVVSFAWSPDGSRLAYLADQENDEMYELWSVRSDGTALVRVSGPLFALGDVEEYRWSPDGSRLAFRADPNVENHYAIFTVRGDGSGLVQISASSTGEVGSDFSWSPGTAGRVAFRQRQANGPVSLSIASSDGSSLISVVAPANSGDVASFAWAPDASRIGYLESTYYALDPTPSWKTEVFTVRPDGSGRTRINAPLVPPYSRVTEFRWSPDSTRIAYRADQQFNARFELFANLAAPTSAAWRINGFLTPSGNVKQDGWEWSGDSFTIGYIADQYVDSVDELFTSRSDGSSNRKVSGALPTNGAVYDFKWSPVGLPRIAYRAEQDGLAGPELYRITADGSSPALLSTLDPAQLVAMDYAWSPDATRILFRDNPYQPALYANHVDANDLVQISPAANWGVESYAWSPVP